jgi:hypothetical protein
MFTMYAAAVTPSTTPDKLTHKVLVPCVSPAGMDEMKYSPYGQSPDGSKGPDVTPVKKEVITPKAINAGVDWRVRSRELIDTPLPPLLFCAEMDLMEAAIVRGKAKANLDSVSTGCVGPLLPDQPVHRDVADFRLMDPYFKLPTKACDEVLNDAGSSLSDDNSYQGGGHVITLTRRNAGTFDIPSETKGDDKKESLSADGGASLFSRNDADVLPTPNNTDSPVACCRMM